MAGSSSTRLDEAGAALLWAEALGRTPDRVHRLTGGLANHVFLVEARGEKTILRASAHPGGVSGASYWLGRLGDLGLPLPRVLASGADHDPPYLILTYREGQELGVLFDELTGDQKRALARDVVGLQRRLDVLPDGPGFGYLASYDDPGARASWRLVVEAHLARSRSWLAQTGAFSTSYVDRVEALVPRFAPGLAAVAPRPFFDDATTKNVLVHRGAFSGLVDLDWLAFGDRLYTVALTRMSLLEAGRSTTYIDDLVEEEGPSEARRRLLGFYTLVFCADFMGGVGMAFNRAVPPEVTPATRTRLTELFETLYQEVASN